MGLHDALVAVFTVGLSMVGFCYGIGLAYALPLLVFERAVLVAAAMVMLITSMFPIFHVSLLLMMIIVHRKAGARPGIPLRITLMDVAVIVAGAPIPWIVGFLVVELTSNRVTP